ncbi:MAG: hypothetical protein LBD21_10925 [Tannerellaceae bacterium]|nr:hypothetical protein [Tannerellaceae bacterium]
MRAKIDILGEYAGRHPCIIGSKPNCFAGNPHLHTFSESFPPGKADLQKRQIFFRKEIQTCRSSDFFSARKCRPAEAPNFFPQGNTDLQKLQFFFRKEMQTCRSSIFFPKEKQTCICLPELRPELQFCNKGLKDFSLGPLL